MTKPTDTHIANLPTSLHFGKPFYSPQGDKIAWILYDDDNNIEIWASDKAGEHMVHLGSYPHPKPGSTEDDHDFDLKWLPSGKGISLREADELYVVTIPAQIRTSHVIPQTMRLPSHEEAVKR